MAADKGLVNLTAEETDRIIDASLYEQLYQPDKMTPEYKTRLMQLVQSMETIDEGVKANYISIESARRDREDLINKFKEDFKLN